MDRGLTAYSPASTYQIRLSRVERLPLEYLIEMRRDLQYAMRALIKSPGFALVS
jgi:hypothetical protein